MNVTEQSDILAQLNTKHANFRGRNLNIVDLRKLSADLKDNTTVEILNLSYNTLQVTGIKTLVSGLLKNTKLRHLNLAYTSLGDEGVKIVADLLETNTSIQHIDLSGNQITSAGATSIANSLCVNTTLLFLNLFDNNVRDLGAVTIATSPGYPVSHISENKITNHAVPSLCRAMNETKMTKLHLHSNKIGDAGCEKLIKEGSFLQVLNLSYNCISMSAINRFQVTTDIPVFDVGFQKTPAITTPIPTTAIPTSIPKRAQKGESGTPAAARKFASQRVTVSSANGSLQEDSGLDYFSLPTLTVDFVQAQMNLASKQMEARALKRQLEELGNEIITSQAVLELLNETGSVTQQTEATKARISKLQEDQNGMKTKLQSVKNQSKQVLESLQGLNLVAAHLETALRQGGGDKVKELETQQKLEILKQIQDFTAHASLESTSKDLTKVNNYLMKVDPARDRESLLSSLKTALDLSLPLASIMAVGETGDDKPKGLERQPSSRQYTFDDVQSTRNGKLMRRITSPPVAGTVESDAP